MDIFIGLDLGTTNAKAVAYSAAGELLAYGSAGYATDYPAPGLAEQRPAEWTKALTSACRQVITALGESQRQISTIAVSAHGPNLILTDSAGRALTDSVPIWQDERCIAQGKRLIQEAGAGWVGLGMPLSGFPARLLWAIENQTEIASRAAYALEAKSYLINWLTGIIATEPSSGPGKDAWWQPVFEAMHWPVERLAPVKPSISTAGMLKAEIAAAFGLKAPVPVVMGLNDGACAVLACGASQPGDVIITLATNGVFRLALDTPLKPDQCLEHALFCYPLVEKAWVAGGQTKCGASALRWITQLSGTTTDDAFEQVLAEAGETAPGSEDVLFLPYLAGRGAPKSDPGATGVFCGLRLSVGRGALTRAVLEGVAFALRDVYSSFHDFGCSMRRIFLVGGGGKSALWRQIIADVFGLSTTYYEADSALGAAIMAALATDTFSDSESAVQAMTSPLAYSEPEPRTTAVYEQVYANFRRLRDALYIPVPAAPLSTGGAF